MLRAAGHSDATLPHRGETAARGPVGWHPRDAASSQQTLQDPGRRFSPENGQGVKKEGEGETERESGPEENKRRKVDRGEEERRLKRL